MNFKKMLTGHKLYQIKLTRTTQVNLVLYCLGWVAVLAVILGCRTLVGEPPEITNFTAPDRISPGETYTLEVTAIDADNDPLTYEWMLSGDGSIDTTTGLRVVFTAPAQFPAKSTITVTVSDGTYETSQIVVYEISG